MVSSGFFKTWYMYTMEYYLVIKEWNLDNIEETRGPRAKWNQPDVKRQMLYHLAYM
jgi:hypothetical protein